MDDARGEGGHQRLVVDAEGCKAPGNVCKALGPERGQHVGVGDVGAEGVQPVAMLRGGLRAPGVRTAGGRGLIRRLTI